MNIRLDLLQLCKMPYCMVPMRTNGWRKTKGKGITYHRLSNGTLKSVWLRNIRRDNPHRPSNSFVCSAHFTVDCFYPATEICGHKTSKKLKRTAVSKLFSFPTTRNEETGRQSSRRQIEARAKVNNSQATIALVYFKQRKMLVISNKSSSICPY